VSIEPTVAVHTDDAEDIVWLLNTLEDWLRHASDDTRDELAEFTGRRTGIELTRLLNELGHQAVRLRRALNKAQPGGPSRE
jgi:hypothetical protein